MLSFIGNVLVITPQVVGLLLLAGVAALVATVRLRHRRRSRPAAVAGLLAVLLVAATAADVVNAHYEYLPRVADLVDVSTWPTASLPAATLVGHRALTPRPHGAVIQLPLPGSTSGFGTHTAYVYLPPQYFSEPSRRFPVLYLLHGSPGAPIDWFRAARAASAGLAAARAGFPVILVAPRASRSWSDDSECVDRPHERVESYLTVDVVTDVDRELRTVRSRSARGLIGNSAGGFCALDLGLRHRDAFAGIGDLSGYDHPTYAGGMAALFGPGPGLAATVAAHDPSRYARHLAPRPRMWVWLDTGRGDAAPRREIRRIERLLTADGQVAVLHERPGGHDYGVWRPALADSVLWLAAVCSRR